MDELSLYYKKLVDQKADKVSEYNTNSFAVNKYETKSNNNSSLSVQREPDIEYEEVNYYLSVSSKERDVSLYPNVNSYVVHFQKEFKNIYSVELIQAIIPDRNDVVNEPYLLLKIDELEDVMVSNDKHVSDAFAILQLAPPTTSGYFIQLDKRIHENTVKYFRIPKASLSKMTVKITDYNGTPFDFLDGATDSASPNKAYQNTFVFKIVCLEKKRAQLSHRNVF
jgi:hypothetical protein